MEFAIATVVFWQSVGFNTTDWRKSVDNTQAIVHLPYAIELVPDARSNSNVAIYSSPSDSLTALLSSITWTVVV